MAILLTAGCVGQKDAAMQGGSAAEDAQIVSGMQPAQVVELKNFLFEPARIEIKEGDVVEFRNIEGAHTVTLASLGIDRQLSGSGTLQVRFNKQGTYNLACTFHTAQGMAGTVTVRPASS